MTDESLPNQSYLLRLWPAQVEGEMVWRARLKDILSGNEQGFADVESLFDYLRNQLMGKSDSDENNAEEVMI